MSRLIPSTRADYPLWRSLQTRWQDVDIYGHVNNVVYLSYFDTAINGWYLEEGLLKPNTQAPLFLVAETGAHYFKEICFPDVVHAGIRLMRLGRSSVTYDIALFTNDDQMASARGRYVHVLVDHKTRKPCPLESHHRQPLEKLRHDHEQ